MSTYEPPALEVGITRLMGTILSPFYRDYANSLGLHGTESVIDFGSGSGNLSRHLAAILQKGGGCLTCVDVSHNWQMVIRDALRGFSSVSFIEGSIQSTGLPEESYDAIVIHFVLHDIPMEERAGIAACLVSKLKQGGKIFVREPNQPGEGMPPEAIQALFAPYGVQVQHCSAVRSRLAGPMALFVGLKRR